MNSWLIWTGGAIAALVVAAALIEAYLKRNTKRRLSDMRPDPDRLKRRPWEADGVAKVRKTRTDIDVETWEIRQNETSRKRWSVPTDPEEYSKAMMPKGKGKQK